MKKKQRKHRMTLTLLTACILFVFMVITILLSGVVGYVLVMTGIIAELDSTSLTPTKAILLISVTSLVLGAMIAAIVSRVPLKPVNKLINQMNRLASGDFKARLRFGKLLSRNKAAIEICDSFNTMAQELENTEVLRSDFINNFSHEFKTPIVSIAGFAKLLKRGSLTEEQRKEYIDAIEEESLRLAYMATNVLNLTKVENQTILSDVTSYNLSEQIRSCVLLLEKKWTDKKLDVGLEFPEYLITANEELLKQVWINLIDNAVKFAPEYGTVEVKIRETEENILVQVINTGSEILPEHQKKLFHKFYQADESHATEGNGIGLAIVKKITELHQGKVSVQSGHGVTVFEVSLPRSR